MSDPKDNTSFFRKVVKFVANPATDWADLSSPASQAKESEFAKSELKAMIERKRRNDFVRKREFDMLRKVRREGLTSEQLAALGGSSRLDDSEGRIADSGAKQDAAVKAKIDAIEQQMVGDAYNAPTAASPRRSTDFYNAPTMPAPLPGGAARADAGRAPAAGGGRTAPLLTDEVPESPAAGRGVAVMGKGVSPLAVDRALPDFGPAPTVEVSEVAHDPDLDEAVIAFANADFAGCEGSITQLIGPAGVRAQHAETWLVLFDLYRAVGQQAKFESLALDYAQTFGWSAPQWFSMPQLVAEAASEQRASPGRLDGQVGWSSPAHLDADAVARLAGRALQMPLPWVLDWAPLRSTDPEGCARLSELFRGWVHEPIEMVWLSGETLFSVLKEAAPAGVRDVDPAVWRLRLDALRMANRADQFDEAAIDYCVTYEVSPPSWERSKCRVRVASANASTMPASTLPSAELSSSFAESQMTDGGVPQAHAELSGQLAGDIASLLNRLTAEIGTAQVVNVSCARLIRVDFIAAGDLLNWVMSRKGENRTVNFTDSNRLVALFFGAMGISEHARVKVRTV
jgi:hypothetical protein